MNTTDLQGRREVRPNPIAEDAAFAQELWARTEAVVV